MSLLALTLSVLAATASVAVALWAWRAMTRQLDDGLRTYASFELMRLDIAAAPSSRPPPSGRFTELSDPPQGLT